MRREQPKPGQHGKYWLSKKPGRDSIDDAWCATWYDKRTRQTRRVSLGTSDVQEASIALAKYAVINDRPLNNSPDQVLVEAVLVRYYEEHARFLPSAKVTRDTLVFWQEFWAGKYVSEITPNEQVKFQQFIRRGKLKSSSVDRVLSSGRAALKRAVKFQELTSAPHIFMVETRREKRARDPMARPITVPEIAALLDNVAYLRVFKLVVLAINTLARPAAIFDLQRRQYNAATSRLDLNPLGREQTNKFRPVIPVSATLRPWLEVETDPNAYYISIRGGRVVANNLKRSLSIAAKAAGIDPIAPYSFRHGMARALRDRDVPLSEISLILGHIHDDEEGASPMTLIYAPNKPDYCKRAIAAIDNIMCEISSLMRTGGLADPTAVTERIDSIRLPNQHLSDYKRRGVLDLVKQGKSNAEISDLLDLPIPTISTYRQNLKKNRLSG